MGYAEKIYEKVKQLPEQTALKVLDFTEYLASRRTERVAFDATAEYRQRRMEVERTFSKYNADLSNFKFDREEANARR